MTTKGGINQSYTRVFNNTVVLNALRKRELSATLIASELNLSNASVSSILKELLAKNIIKVSKSEASSKVGRKQVFYTLNDDFGLIVAVSLSDKHARVVVSNINEQILLETSKDIDVYDLQTIYEIILDTKQKLDNSNYKNIQVKSVVISVPGRVNKKTGELQLSKQYDSTLFENDSSIAKLFSKYFNCEALVYNDIYLEAIGEQSTGAITDMDNALIVHVDEGIGSSFILNGRPYRGELGYAGELGLMRTSYKGTEGYLDDFVSLRSIKEKLNIVHTSTLVEKYEEHKNEYKVVIESAHILGRLLKDIQEFLNLGKIVLSGRVELFNGDYIETIKEELDKAYARCEVSYSTHGHNGSIYGAINIAINNLTNENSETCNK